MAEDSEGITVKKDENFSEWFSQLMKKASLADVRYHFKGFPVYMPWAVRGMRKIQRMWEEELERKGHEPLLMPLLIPKENFEREADHIEGFTPEVFWVTEVADKKLDTKYALRPTSETVMYDMFSKWIRSYNDLPLKRYQSVSVYRYDSKMTRPFMRTRELYWTEAHNMFSSEEETYEQVKEDMDTTYKLLFGKLALPHIFFKRPQWDKFPGAMNTYAADVLLPSGKVLQLPSTHQIGSEFPGKFGVSFKDKDGNDKPGWATCYGPCHSRNYGALITFHGDDKGLVLPWDVAPQQIVVIPIMKKGSEEDVMEKSRKVKEELENEGYSVNLDERKDYSPGWKFNQWEMKGIPIRVEIGPKDVENNKVAVFRRDTGEKNFVSDEEYKEHIKNIKETFTENLKEKASKSVENKTKNIEEKDEIKKALEEGNIVRTSFCSTDMDGEKCAEVVEKELGGEIRGEHFGKSEEVFCNCPVCGKEAKHVVYIAKSH